MGDGTSIEDLDGVPDSWLWPGLINIEEHSRNLQVSKMWHLWHGSRSRQRAERAGCGAKHKPDLAGSHMPEVKGKAKSKDNPGFWPAQRREERSLGE